MEFVMFNKFHIFINGAVFKESEITLRHVIFESVIFLKSAILKIVANAIFALSDKRVTPASEPFPSDIVEFHF